MPRKLKSIFAIPITSLMLSVLISNPAMSADYAYIVVSASAKGEAAKPYWVVLSGRHRDTYLQVDKPVHRLLAGRYYIDHLGFSKARETASGDRSLPELDIKMKLEKDTIYFIGEVVLSSERNRSREYEIAISMDTSLLKKACESDPDLFARLPLKIRHSVDPNQEYQLNCETMQVSSYKREN